jgi:hypothetical protein
LPRGSSPVIAASRPSKSSGCGPPVYSSGLGHSARAVGSQLDTVTVGVRQVDGLVHAVVGGALDRGLRRRQTQCRARQLLARGEQQREVVEARVAPGAPCARLLVEDEQILLARAHHCQGVLPAVQPQADGVLVEGYRAIEVCHGQVHRSEAQRRGQLR